MLVEDWRIEDNTVRPRSALGYLTPTNYAKAWTALLRCADPGQAEGQPPLDQIAKTSSSNATATRRLVGSSTASS